MKTKGIYFLYRTLQAFGLPVLLLYFLARGLRNPGYWRSLLQRFGFLPHSFRQTGPGAIWLHAVSVGEVLASVAFLRRLRQQFPQTALFVSTATLAGRATADEKLHGLADGVFFAPVDYVFAVRRVLRTLRPSVVAVVETEIWPNLFREVKRSASALAVLNGRISDRAFPRYRRFAWFFQAVLPAADSILTQTAVDRERFLALGAAAAQVREGGNWKYDFTPRPAPEGSPVLALLARAPQAKVWIAASTMPPAAAGDEDEDDAVIAAFQELAERHPELLLILAPRKPDRFDAAARKLHAAGIPYLRRSALAADGGQAPPRVLLLDSIGELSGLFPLADAVFMGGTLARRGGHNILEPALFGKAAIAGPHMENFQAMADEFAAAGACIRIGHARELAPAVERLLQDPAAARVTGERARACAEARRGATGRALDEVRRLYSSHIPRYRPAMPWLAIAMALAYIWQWGARRKQARDRARQRRLDVPVISVGNITMGGTGKTPCVLWLAEALAARGHSPGILTRGYGRSSPHRHLVAPPGAVLDAAQAGDEPSLLVRSGLAPVGVGSDRFQTGCLLRSQFGVDVLLLDDGFQHLRLARDVYMVLIDALNPFGGGGLFPLGRLREPLAGLARAGLIVITRAESSDLVPAIEHAVRQWNPRAPIFRASVQPQSWVDHRTGARYPAACRPFERAGAFCGLGNPQSFRRTLRGMGLEPVDWIEFEDHHRYRPHELRHLAHQFQDRGADALVTTEKDAVNLCEWCDGLLAPLPLYWLQVVMVIHGDNELLDEIVRRLG